MSDQYNEYLPDLGNKTTWKVVQDFLNDFFGCFFPGIYFSLFFSITIFCTFLSVHVILGYTGPDIPFYITELLKSSSPEFFLFFVVFSFIIGSIFYREDPKQPDRISAHYIWRKSSDRAGLAVQTDDKGNIKVDYPYHFIYEYLLKRGLWHLAKHIPWQGGQSLTFSKRSKMFINILKI
jgi:hypothetical protein